MTSERDVRQKWHFKIKVKHLNQVLKYTKYQKQINNHFPRGLEQDRF